MAGIYGFVRKAWSYLTVVVLAATVVLLIDYYGKPSIGTKIVYPVLVEIGALCVLALISIDNTKRFFHFLDEQLGDPKYRANKIMLIFSIVVIVVILHVYLYTSSGGWDKQGGPWSYFASALTGLVTTIFGVTVYDFVVKPFERLIEGQEREHFLGFFGKSCEQEGIILVFQSRVLDKDRLVQGLEAAGVGDDESLRKKVGKIVDTFIDYPFIISNSLGCNYWVDLTQPPVFCRKAVHSPA